MDVKEMGERREERRGKVDTNLLSQYTSNMKNPKEQTKNFKQREEEQRLNARCLLLAPSNTPLIKSIKKALENFYSVITPSDVPSHGSLIVDKVTSLIVDSDLIIADVSTTNPNTMYEIGVAVGLRKPVLLIRDKKTENMLLSAFAGWLSNQ
ncbi:hypothetical protein CEE36_05355 [candidate division TA06 bacterium B3_TA06]|uniref:Uncharacterized protein n=1 Tax=candidate division TA06 bacterium B3_TA06 TaxID=2012487 RepID=A0A532V7K5_UNCT6|nr:MAG: hypothetical protein CEE36_05355 [candidate division TA06 bacterium B3_TA06]